MYLDFISDDEINNKIFSELVQLDTRLGTPASEQLAACFLRTNRSDITKVTSFVLMLDLKLFQIVDFQQYESIRNENWAGFAHIYLYYCNEKSRLNAEIDIDVYTKLVQLDAKFGTKVFEQLSECLLNTTRSDIIKVACFI